MHAITLNLAKSKFSLIYLITVYSIALVTIGLSCWQLNISKYMIIIIFLPILLKLSQDLRQHVFQTSKNAVKSLIFNINSLSWSIINPNAAELRIKLCPDSIITSAFILLNFKIRGSRRRHSVLIFCKEADIQQYRHLQVNLRHFANNEDFL